MNTILSINGSDSMGHSGIQSDIRTIQDLGGYAATAVTSVTVQNAHGIADVHELPSELIVGQIRAIYEESRPKAIKIGMINDAETIRRVREEIVGCPNIVCSPVILSANGGTLMSNDAIQAFVSQMIPISNLLILKCTDAEIILGRRITTDQDMISAALSLQSSGAQWILLRGGTYMEGRINALLIGDKYQTFFSSVNTSGWQRHGVVSTLSTAIATQLAFGDDVPAAVSNAHNYLHNQVVYASSDNSTNLRPKSLYNNFLSEVTIHFRTKHEVNYYADKLNISPRYLSQVTGQVGGRTPKQIIDNLLIYEAERLLSTSTQTIQEISNALGFTSQVTFTKFFKAKKGMSPSVFRQKLGI